MHELTCKQRMMLNRDTYNNPYLGTTQNLIDTLNIDDEISQKIINDYVENMTCKNLLSFLTDKQDAEICRMILNRYPQKQEVWQLGGIDWQAYTAIELINILCIDQEMSEEIIDLFVEDMTCENLFKIIGIEKQEEIRAYILRAYPDRIMEMQNEGSL